MWWIACASAPSGSKIAPCWEEWTRDQLNDAMVAFGYDAEGKAHRNLALEEKLDYLDAYCRAANAALGQKPLEPELSWWERSWLGRLLR